jgi:voltage-gated potassium channel
LGLRTKIYGLLDPYSHSHAARQLRIAEVFVILVGISSVSAGTVESLSPATRMVAAVITGLVATLFFLEYLVRFWVAPETVSAQETTVSQARWRWAVSAEGIVNLLAIVPAIATASGEARLGAESASMFVLLWVVKLATHAPGVGLIARVFHNERSALAAAAALFAIVIFSAATVAYWLEGERQPEHFGNIPAALWWAVVTLTTTGYGDTVPLGTAGRMVGGIVMVCGICVLALLAGILATGFAAEVHRVEFVRIWELVARVPFFAETGAVAISDIVERLRSRSYPAGATVLRKGEPGDSMYFIVTGAVEVFLKSGTRTLADGDFFGEMALLDRRPRSADVITKTPCTLLVLNVADFYQLASQQPALISAIEAEAKRRRGSDATVSS